MEVGHFQFLMCRSFSRVGHNDVARFFGKNWMSEEPSNIVLHIPNSRNKTYGLQPIMCYLYFFFRLAVMFFDPWQVQKWAKYLNSSDYIYKLVLGDLGGTVLKTPTPKKNYVTKYDYHIGRIHLPHLWIHKYFMDNSSVNFL